MSRQCAWRIALLEDTHVSEPLRTCSRGSCGCPVIRSKATVAAPRCWPPVSPRQRRAGALRRAPARMTADPAADEAAACALPLVYLLITR